MGHIEYFKLVIKKKKKKKKKKTADMREALKT